MQFTTIWFWIFFAITFIIYYLGRPTWRWAILLVASLFFYAQLKAPQLLIALFLVTTISYTVGRLLSQIPIGSNKRKRALYIGVLLNILVLITIRYLPTLRKSLFPSFEIPNVIITAGVSFYVFQAISYLIDVYYGEQPSEHHLGYFALYISFFPKVLQGPIERYSKLLPQLRHPKALSDETIQSAFLLILWGLYKKLIIADRLSILVGGVYDNLLEYIGISLWLATFLYALQIYCDFSSYTDIAIGVARLLGIDLSINFNKPYLAISVPDFWRRWHISFSTWIFDYIFKPVQIGIRKLRIWANPFALLVTFFLSGIWHGANWGFIIWGLLHGFYMATYALIAPYEKKFLRRYKLENSALVRALRMCITFQLVSFAWIFFRAKTLSDAWYVVSHLFSGFKATISLLTDVTNYANAGQGKGLFQPLTFSQSFIDLSFVIAGIIILLIVELPKNLAETRLGIIFKKNLAFRWLIYWLLVMSIILTGVSTQAVFVYFQF